MKDEEFDIVTDEEEVEESSKKQKITIKDFFNLTNLICFVASLIIGGLIYVIFCLCKDFSLYNSLDGMFVATSVIIFIGLFDLILNKGTFDVIAVGFSNFGRMFKKDPTKKYDGIYEYQELKKKKRLKYRFRFLSFLIAGIILLTITLVLYSQYYNSLS